MTTAPAEVERLIAESREDDQRMPPAPWEWDGKAKQLVGPFKEPPEDEDDPGIRHVIAETDSGYYPPSPAVAAAIARQRNNLASMADQLSAARSEIDRLRSLWGSTPLSVTAVAFENQRLREEIDRLTAAAQLSRSGAAEAVCDHDKLVNENEQLRTRLEHATEAYRYLGALELRVGDVVDEADVALIERHLEELRAAAEPK